MSSTKNGLFAIAASLYYVHKADHCSTHHRGGDISDGIPSVVLKLVADDRRCAGELHGIGLRLDEDQCPVIRREREIVVDDDVPPLGAQAIGFDETHVDDEMWDEVAAIVRHRRVRRRGWWKGGRGR